MSKWSNFHTLKLNKINELNINQPHTIDTRNGMKYDHNDIADVHEEHGSNDNSNINNACDNVSSNNVEGAIISDSADN